MPGDEIAVAPTGEKICAMTGFPPPEFFEDMARRQDALVNEFSEEVERRYHQDPLFHARVECVARILRNRPTGDPIRLAAAWGVLMAERDPTTEAATDGH